MAEAAQRTPPSAVFRFTSVPINATLLPIPSAPQQQQQQQAMDEENAPLEPTPSTAAPPPSKRKSFAMQTMSVSPPPTPPPTQPEAHPGAVGFSAAATTGHQVVQQDSPPAAQRRRSVTASDIKQSSGQDRSIQVSCAVGEVMRIPLSGKTVPFRVVKRRGRGFSSVVFECEEETPEEVGADPRVVTVKVLSGGESGMGTCLHEVETLAFLKVKREEAGLTRERSRFAELASWFYRRSSVGGVDHVCLVFRGGGVSLWEAMSARSPPPFSTAALVTRSATDGSPPSRPSLAWGVREVVEVARGLLEGIAFLHSVGLIHADIKPDNVALYPPSPAQPS
ncbi:unnamed protein product, partial [Hapterophycus canaliculatus]